MNYPYRLDNAGVAQLLKTGLTDLFYLSVDNEDASARYVQIFDAAAIAEVTLGGTVAKHAFKIPASGTREINPAVPWRFQRGIVLAVTTTKIGAIAVTAPAGINARLG